MSTREYLISIIGFFCIPITLGVIFGFMVGIIGGVWSFVVTTYYLRCGKGKYANLTVLTVLCSTVLFSAFFVEPKQELFFYLTFIPWIFFFIIRKRLYHFEKPKEEHVIPRSLDEIILKKSKRCIFCKRHPVSKRYHLEHSHKMKIKNIDDHFENCGCKNCTEITYYGI